MASRHSPSLRRILHAARLVGVLAVMAGAAAGLCLPGLCLPAHVARMVIADAGRPLLDRQPMPSAANVAMVTKLLLGPGAAGHERAGVDGIGEQVVDRRVADAWPAHPLLAGAPTRQQFALRDHLADDLAGRAAPAPQLEHASDRVPDLSIPPASAAISAPLLRAAGSTLVWNAIPGVTSYEVATVPNPATSRDTTYRIVTGTSYAPPPVPGQTVNYGVKANVSGAQWGKEVSVTWPGGSSPPSAATAPTLTLSGTTLSWTAMTGVSSYQIATISNPSTTRNTTYQTVTGTSFTPPEVRGQTVNYSVRSYLAGTSWATEVSITWPANNTPANNTPANNTPANNTPANNTPTNNTQTPLETTAKLKVGVMNIGNYNYSPFNSAQVFSKAGVTYTREDVGGGANVGTCNGSDYVCTALRNGITPMVLFEGYADSNMTSELVSLAQHLNTLAATYPVMNKMHVIEFGNEVYAGTSGPKENGSTYGQQYYAAHAALAAAGLGDWKLLAIGTTDCYYGAQNWIPQVIAAQAAGAAGVDGWTVHPYGPMTNDTSGGCPAGYGEGWLDVVDYHTIAIKNGSNAPWYVTEVGSCLGGSGCHGGSFQAVPEGTRTDLPGTGSPPFYNQAADMRQYLMDAGGDALTGTPAKYPWIAAFIWYQVYDDNTGWFGLLSNGSNLGQPVNYQRPAFTVLQQWIAANGEGLSHIHTSTYRCEHRDLVAEVVKDDLFLTTESHPLSQSARARRTRTRGA